jgi:uncharacterized protein YbjT (DUF2867 family)
LILVTGAAGKTGRAVIRALAAKGQRVRALVHRDAQRNPVESLGAQEVIVGDMHEESTLRAAAQGARAVYHVCPNIHPDELLIGRVAIAAARAVGVERFVFHSVLHPQIQAMPHHWNKLHVEEALLESQMSYTILRPSNYMQNVLAGLLPSDYRQNVLAGWRMIVESGVYMVPYSVKSGTRTNMVDLEDVAHAASVVLTEPGHLGATYELAGPDILTQTEIAQILGKHLKRQVRVEELSVEAWMRNAKVVGMGDYQIETLAKMFQYYDRYDFLGNSLTLSSLIGRAPKSFDAFIERKIRESVGSHSPQTEC